MTVQSKAKLITLSERLKNLLDTFLVFLLTLVAYASTMPQKITLEDAGLFQMVCNLEGISHPPGYPLFTLLCQQMTLTPTVVNGNLISALFASLALVVFYRIVLLLTTDRLTALIAAFSYGFSSTFWSQAIIIEVYSLAALLFMLAWWLALRFALVPSWPRWAWLCFAVGLGLSNHWPLMVLSCLGVVVVLTTRWQYLISALRSPLFWLLSLACVGAGLLPYLSLVLNPEPEIAVHGGVGTWADFFRYIARSSYSDHQETAGLNDKLQFMSWLSAESVRQLGWVTLPFVVVGIITTWRRWTVATNLSIVLIYLASTFILLMLVGFDYSFQKRAIFLPYPLIAYSALALWYAVGIRTSMAFVTRTNKPLKIAGAILSVLVVCAGNYFRLDRSDAFLADAYARVVLGSLPPQAILFVHGDNELGSIGYLNRVEGIRPDVELRNHEGLVFRNRLGSAFDDEEVRDPRLLEFLKSTPRPVFSTFNVFAPRTEFGLVHRLNKSGVSNIRINPELDIFLDYLLELYEQDLVFNEHEKLFLFSLLARFGEQYALYANDNSHNGFDLVSTRRFERLQLTYPGKIEMLKVWLDQPAGSRSKLQLLQLADAAKLVMPLETSPKSEGILYSLYGRAYLLETPDYDKAVGYFDRSVKVMPSVKNPSLCLLVQNYQNLGQNEEVTRLRHKFPTMSCD